MDAAGLPHRAEVRCHHACEPLNNGVLQPQPGMTNWITVRLALQPWQQSAVMARGIRIPS